MGREEKKENFRRMNDVRLKAINRCGAVLIAATLRTFRLPVSPCAVSKVRTGPLQDLRVLETIFRFSWFFVKNTSVVFFSKFHLHHYISLRPAANPKVSHDQQRTSGDCCRGKGPLPVQLKCASLTSFAFSSIQFYILFFKLYFKSFLGVCTPVPRLHFKQRAQRHAHGNVGMLTSRP